MTTPADATADERAFAACLAGRPVPDGAAGLAAFTHAVRAGATEPGRPNAALAELLVTGLLVPTQEPSRGTAGRPARTSRKRPRMLISTLVAKFAAAGAVAKAAAGTGVVVVALTGTATTVALSTEESPAVVQNGDTVVPEAPDDALGGDTTTDTTGDTSGTDTSGTDTSGTGTSGTDTGEGGSEGELSDDPATDIPVATEPTLTPEEWAGSSAEAPSHGSWVSEGARNGWVTGERVSDAAHQRNADRQAARDDADEPVADTPAEQPEPEESVEVAPAPAPAQTGGHGDGGSNGKGNGKNGK
ncbi:hypothetical protein [Geodermatophilus sp. SYSU D01176]